VNCSNAQGSAVGHDDQQCPFRLLYLILVLCMPKILSTVLISRIASAL